MTIQALIGARSREPLLAVRHLCGSLCRTPHQYDYRRVLGAPAGQGMWEPLREDVGLYLWMLSSQAWLLLTTAWGFFPSVPRGTANTSLLVSLGYISLFLAAEFLCWRREMPVPLHTVLHETHTKNGDYEILLEFQGQNCIHMIRFRCVSYLSKHFYDPGAGLNYFH